MLALLVSDVREEGSISRDMSAVVGGRMGLGTAGEPNDGVVESGQASDCRLNI